jgi:hypothetical protein
MDSDCSPDRHPTSPNKRAKNLMTVIAKVYRPGSFAVLSTIGVLISSGLAMPHHSDPTDAVRQVRDVRSESLPAGLRRLPDNGEFLIDTSVTLVSALGDQSDPAIAFDGTNFLVVWRDGYEEIFGARVTPQGTVLDPAGIEIAHSWGDQASPAVSFDGSNYLVVWSYLRGGCMGISGARVTPQGTVLDSMGIDISRAVDHEDSPSVGFDGTNFLVVWQDDRAHVWIDDVYGARVTPQGAVLDTAGFAISRAANSQQHPALGLDGANFLVVWQDYRNNQDTSDIYGARVTPQGTVLDASGIAISRKANDQWSPALAFDGVSFLVMWEDKRVGSWDIYGARVTPQGAVLDTGGIMISHAAGERFSPGLSFDGVNFLVAWEDGRHVNCDDIYGARVTPQGIVLDTAGIQISHGMYLAEYERLPVVGFDDANFIVVWEDYRGSNWDVRGKRVTSQGVVLDSASTAISTAANFEGSPALVFAGESFLVAWQDDRNGSDYDIYGARLTSQGAVLDPSGFVISQASSDQSLPAAGFDGSNLLVAWQDVRGNSGADIYGARVTPGGTVLDSSGFAVSIATGNQVSPAVGFDGSNFLVVWADDRAGDGEIYGARVTPQGTVLDTAGFVIAHAGDYQAFPALAFDGTNFLVVSEDDRGGDDCDVYGARVTPQGVVLDTAGLAISQATGYQESPALAFDGTNFLVVWEDYRSGDDCDVYGARVTPQGVVLDSLGFPVSEADDDQALPALSLDGSDLLVVWQDSRNGSDWDLYGARVTSTGVVLDSGPIVRDAGSQVRPALARGEASSMAFVYQGWTDTFGAKNYRTYRIWGKMDPNPAIAQTNEPDVRTTNCGATIVRGALFLTACTSVSPCTSCLLDASGRKVLDLKPGANDVRALSPGVYFVREGPGTRGEGLGKTRKVVVTR